MLTVSLSLLAIVIVLLALAALVLHYGYRAPRTLGTSSPEDMGIRFETLWLNTPNGKNLFAWFLPVNKQAPVIVILHGWGSSAGLMLPLATPFYRHGYNVLLLDARNHGRSDSDGHSSLPRFAEDLRVALTFLQKHPERHNGKLILMGHSVGAGAVLYEASLRQDISAVISLSAFAHPDWVMRRQLKRFPLPGFLVSGILRYIQWIIGIRFEDIAPMNTACKISCPVLLVHGKNDNTVPVSDACAIRQHCKRTKLELLLIEGAGHNSIDKIEQHAHELFTFLNKADAKPGKHAPVLGNFK
jgi:alpha-beta hydrolase superfamily lysophospholipase